MPTSKLFPTSKKSGTIRFLPYENWEEYPQVKNEKGEIVDKYPEAVKHIGYECKAPTPARIAKVEKLVQLTSRNTLKSNKALMLEIERLSKYTCEEIIVDWFDDPGFTPTEDEDYESEEWDDAKKTHEECFCNNPEMLYQFWNEYQARFNYQKKRELDDF